MGVLAQKGRAASVLRLNGQPIAFWETRALRWLRYGCADFLPSSAMGGNPLKNMVLPLGLNSNRVEELQVIIKDWLEIYKSPPKLDGKSFRWK
jgi:hypothetical protein